MNTMEITKIVAGLCGSLLVFLGVKYFVAEPLYHPGSHGHAELAYKLEIEDAETAPAVEETIDYAALVAAADPAAGEKRFSKCKACHKLEVGKNAVGPSLFAVVDRDVGAAAGYSYSSAMTGAGGKWTAERLAEFLHDPKAYVPGTKMTFAGFRKPQDAANVVAYLATVK